MKPVPLSNPPNPWATTEVEYLEGAPEVRLEVYEDHTRQILSKNDSPDVGFTWSVNPYRGCFHACAYCYARPSHEYLSWGAGTDFDRKIVVKPRRAGAAARGLREADVEERDGRVQRRHRLLPAARGVVPADARLPRGLRRDGEPGGHHHQVAADRARRRCCWRRSRASASVHVTVSIPFWDPEKARAIEPYVATPIRRMHIIEKLARAGIEVGVNVAPVIPGLNDQDMPRVLTAARDAGATHAGFVLLRLPGSVKAVFEERLRASLPLQAERVLHRIRETRGGELYDPRFGVRGRGEGIYAEAIKSLFQSTAARLGLATHH